MAAATATLTVAGCGAGLPQTLPEQQPLSANEIETYARRHLESARALRNEGRIEAAARVAARGLELRPDEPALQSLRAQLLDELGRHEEARGHRRVAAALVPGPPPLPDVPLVTSSRGIIVTLLPPLDDSTLGSRVPRDWPSGPVAMTLEDRAHTRLPAAWVRHADPDSVAMARDELVQQQARAALSVRVDRAFCGESIKDGNFAVAWLRVAATSADSPSPRATEVREEIQDPQSADTCREEAIARALETALALPEVSEALAASPPAAGASWTSAALRALYPGIARHQAREIEAGRAHMAGGDLAGAAERFKAAAAVDPHDLDARAFLDDVEMSLTLSRELAPVSSPSPETLAAVGATQADLEADVALSGRGALFSPEERARIEARLAEEQAIRDELLAALEVLDEDRLAPSATTIATFRPARMPDEPTTATRLAGQQSGGRDLESRVSYSRDGAVLARYFFPAGTDTPLLREEDSDGDTRADRWVAYRDGARHQVWEDRTGRGRPDLHLQFARGGSPLVRLDVDADGDGRTERVFKYDDGRLITEDRDTDGDGRADLFERFDHTGSLALREEDLNGDGHVDVRTAYSSGRLVRREILDPEAVTEIQ